MAELTDEQKAFLARVLPGVDLFQGMDEAHVQQAISFMQMRSYGYGDHVFNAGDEGDAFFVVFRGTVAIDKKGGFLGLGTKTLARLSSGQCFGEMALITREPRTADAVCAEPTQLLSLGAMEFDILLAKNPLLAAKVAALVEQRKQVK